MNNLPVLKYIPKFILIFTPKGKRRNWVYLPEIDKTIDSIYLDDELMRIGKTPQEWYDRWVLNIVCASDRPKSKTGRNLKFNSISKGYFRKTEEDHPIEFNEWMRDVIRRKSESKKTRSSSQIRRYQDPEERRKTGYRTKESLSSPEMREKISRGTKKGFTKEVRDKLSKSLLEYYSKPENRSKLSSIRKATASTEEFRRADSLAQLRRYQNPEERRKTGESVKNAIRRDPSIPKRIGDGIRNHYKDPKAREKRSEASSLMWKNPTDKMMNRIQSSRYRGTSITKYSIWENKVIHLDSKWELKFLEICEDIGVRSVVRCRTGIRYYKSTELRYAYYIPDFLVND